MREQHSRVRVQSDAGAQQYGVIRFVYQASVERIAALDVRVIKPEGSVVATPPDSIQDMTSGISRDAPFYSDLREKHVAVKGLGAGDTLELLQHEMGYLSPEPPIAVCNWCRKVIPG
jgi:Domain of Unknown Function with PDB structure (DUF3857)